MLYKLDHISGKLYCRHCSLIDIDSGALWILKSLAREFHKATGKSLYVTSGARCPICNRKVGGTPGSAHLVKTGKRSKAFNVATISNRDRYVVLRTLYEIGIKRLGVYPKRRFIHWDVALEKDGYKQEICWGK